jgi:hypothetical protein
MSMTTGNNGSGQYLLDQTALATDDDFDDLGGGIRSSFPVISYRGSKWRLRYQGQEQLMLDDRGSPVPEIAVALLRVPDHLSKRFYIGGYPGDESARRPPDCWSNDGIRPDPTLTVPEQPDGRPVPTQCARCFFDAIGSMVSQDGKKKMKACGDYKRVAVKLYYPIVAEELVNIPMLLTVPAASLQNLKAYGAFLKAHKVHALARVTYIKLDDDTSFQRQQFRHGPALSDEEYLNVKSLRASDDVAAIIRQEIVEAADPLGESGTLEGVSAVIQPRPTVQQPQQPPVQQPPVQQPPVAQPSPAPAATARPAQPSPLRSPLPQPGVRPMPPVGAPSGPAPVPAARAVTAGSINSALLRPSPPPASARVVQHPSSVQKPPVEYPSINSGQEQPEEYQGDDAIMRELHEKFNTTMRPTDQT